MTAAVDLAAPWHKTKGGSPPTFYALEVLGAGHGSQVTQYSMGDDGKLTATKAIPVGTDNDDAAALAMWNPSHKSGGKGKLKQDVVFVYQRNNGHGRIVYFKPVDA